MLWIVLFDWYIPQSDSAQISNRSSFLCQYTVNWQFWKIITDCKDFLMSELRERNMHLKEAIYCCFQKFHKVISISNFSTKSEHIHLLIREANKNKTYKIFSTVSAVKPDFLSNWSLEIHWGPHSKYTGFKPYWL